MVVAEVPLWVVHDSGLIADDAGTTANPTSSIVRHHHHSTNPEERAYQTLDFLLSPSSSVLQGNNDKSNHKKKKCAVYSLDIHPDGTKFATAGGDGTVRIWNMEALFYNPAASSNNKTPTTKNDSRVAKFDDGAYVSTDYSSSETDDTDDVEPRNNGSHTKSTNQTKRSKDDGDDDAMSTSSSSSGHLLSPLVHDLNSVVRRKKNKNDNTTGMNDSSSSRLTEPQSSLVSEKNSTETTAASVPSAVAGGDTKNDDKSNNHHHHHRLLCTLSAHTGSSVLIVRFSNSGKYLASAADDACVCIYAPSLYSTHVGNLTSTNNVEHWTRIRLLRGHTLDVVDLTWSPDDTYLVSCSLDSETPIAVWNVRDLGSIESTSSKVFVKPYRILGVNVHTSTVKGVSFDPAGSYLASSGDDPAVCIWRTDDWGLEKRIDSQDGIFRTWANNDELSNQSLFRRISWSADGSFVCSTNSVVKNKHVLSTITREGWKAGEQSANLIGHKQPIVVCRNSLHLLSNKTSTDKMKEEDDDDDPDYATLLAIGDRRGFVTVWSTKKSRPLFKLQCSETRCTVTDLAWGRRANDGDLILLVSLLDGQVTALKFGVPDELGHVLTPKQKARVFQLRYGIEMTTDGHGGAWSHKQLFAGAGGRSTKLIENAIQLSLEDQQNEDNGDDDDEVKDSRTRQPEAEGDRTKRLSVKQTQEESMSKSGKKRIRPVLLTQVGETSSSKADVMSPSKKQQKPVDPLQNAIDVADRAAETAVRMEKIRTKSGGGGDVDGVNETDDRGNVASPPPRTPHSRHMTAHALVSSVVAIPHSTDRSHTADLPSNDAAVPDSTVVTSEKSVLIAECNNSVKVPIGSRGIAIPCADVSIVKNGRVVWKDQIVGASCSAISASKYLLAVGFVDGSIQLYGTSQTIGWSCGTGFRSHPPLILLNGHPIVTLQLRERKQHPDKCDAGGVDLLVVSADGSFGVYTVLPEFGLSYKGSVLTAMTHMAASSPSMLDHHRLPKLSRMYITETGRLVLMLSLQQQGSSSSPSRSGASGPVDVGAGGSLQAFLYERKLESWMRISDSRFLLSDYYSVLPAISDKGSTDSTDMGSTVSTMRSGSRNVLRQIDDSIRLGSLHSTLKKATSHTQQGSRRGGDVGSLLLYSNDMEDEDDYVNFVATRSHCEDRMSCALALGSVDEFKHWLTLYVKVLVRASHGAQLRTLTDMLLGKIGDTPTTDITNNQQNARCSWWLDDASAMLGLNRKSLVQSIIIPEMSKNRALQRITNEIALEIDSV